MGDGEDDHDHGDEGNDDGDRPGALAWVGVVGRDRPYGVMGVGHGSLDAAPTAKVVRNLRVDRLPGRARHGSGNGLAPVEALHFHPCDGPSVSRILVPVGSRSSVASWLESVTENSGVLRRRRAARRTVSGLPVGGARTTRSPLAA